MGDLIRWVLYAGPSIVLVCVLLGHERLHQRVRTIETHLAQQRKAAERDGEQPW